ncbi:hypothetical protein [Streptomyces sp. Rer75]|uniref:hypothetical protein n=1 Tax=Streptomyces sp. Rer75 TaxID=2750011 RepID=UPI0015D0045F|nr:hypothetical protein [Streptomyces sp. Rer75]QLH21292.1 hypothetical protein HYQ63_12185 [Streptomyces sp. Rer75]
MDPIFRLPPNSPLAVTVSDDWGLIPLRVPAGWNVIYNQLSARRLPDGRVEANDSEDLYWARTAPPPWLTAEEVAEVGGLRAREINIDAGWYDGCGFRVVVLDPDWDHERASCTTPDLDEFVATLEAWMWVITQRGKFPES